MNSSFDKKITTNKKQKKQHSPVLRVVLSVLKGNTIKVFLLVLTVFAAVICSLLPPLVLETIVNNINLERTITINFAIIYFAFILSQGIFDALKEVLLNVLGQKLTRQIRISMCQKLQNLPASYFVENETGKTMSRFISDVGAIEGLFKNGVVGMFVDVIKILFILVIIFFKSTGLGIVMMLSAPLIFFVSRIFKNNMRKYQLANRRAVAKINNHVSETATAMRTIKTLKRVDFMKSCFSAYTDESYIAGQNANLYEAVYTPMINELRVIITAVVMLLVAIGGGFQTFFGISVGTAVAIIDYIGKIFVPIENIGMELQNLQSALAGIKRVDELLLENEKEKTVFTYNDLDFNTSCAIEVNNVSFSYGESEILSSVNLNVKSGENITLIGRTGAGKSTIYKLILGLYKPQNGSVKVFGKDAHLICDSDKRKLIGYVEQQVKLVNGSVKDQITLFDDSISDEEVINSLKLSTLFDCVNNLPNGINTLYTDGLFSQGQLQLINIARAVVCNPKILLLDEITANLDSETEYNVVRAISEVSKNRTVVSVSHRGNCGAKTRVVKIEKNK